MLWRRGFLSRVMGGPLLANSGAPTSQHAASGGPQGNPITLPFLALQAGRGATGVVSGKTCEEGGCTVA